MTEKDDNPFCSDSKPEPTEEEIKTAWVRLGKTNLKGKRIILCNRGGDMWEIDATIERVIPVLGLGIILSIRNAKFKDQEKQTPKNLKEARYILLDIPEYPPEFRKTDILLPAGGLCVNETWEYQLGGELDIGFIYF